MFDFDDEFDALDDFIEYSIIFGDDDKASCPSCDAKVEATGVGTTSCPNCGVTIRIE